MQHCRAESGWGVEEEPWQSHTFSELSRQQQNTEIYQVSTQFWSAALQCCTVGQAVAGTVVALGSQLDRTRHRLAAVLARLEQAELRAAGELGSQQPQYEPHYCPSPPQAGRAARFDDAMAAVSEEELEWGSRSLSPDQDWQPAPDPATIARHRANHPKAVFSL